MSHPTSSGTTDYAEASEIRDANHEIRFGPEGYSMTKKKQLTKRQLAVIAELFTGELDEQAVLEKHKVTPAQFEKWQSEPAFIEQLEARIAAAYRQSAALIARYAPLAAAKLVALTESDKEETARKACLDILSLRPTGTSTLSTALKTGPLTTGESACGGPFSPETASRLLAALAENEEGCVP